MKTLFILLPILALVGTSARAADNAVLITLDGLRWQEVFRGLDYALATHGDYSPQSEMLLERFWADSAEERGYLLLPFLHGTVFSGGVVIGNRDAGSCARVNNPWYFSYPGYSEILSGVVNERIDSNRKVPNPEKTLHELLDARPGWQGRTAAFASWDVFPYIFNVARSGIHVNAFAVPDEAVGQHEQWLASLHADIPTPWPTVRNDAFTHHYALSWLGRERPRLLYIGYGETDDFAHDGRYDEYILAAHRTDRFIREVWETIQSMSGYRGNTVLFIAVDHGRGETPIETWQHHASKRSVDGYMKSLARYEDGIVGSEAVWLAALGPGIVPRGLIATGGDCVSNDRIAATLLEILGQDYRALNPAMGAPLTELLQ